MWYLMCMSYPLPCIDELRMHLRQKKRSKHFLVFKFKIHCKKKIIVSTCIGQTCLYLPYIMPNSFAWNICLIYTAVFTGLFNIVKKMCIGNYCLVLVYEHHYKLNTYMYTIMSPQVTILCQIIKNSDFIFVLKILSPCLFAVSPPQSVLLFHDNICRIALVLAHYSSLLVRTLPGVRTGKSTTS